MNDLCDDIIRYLSSLKISGKRADDTRQIKTGLATMGQDKEYCVSCHGLERALCLKRKFVNREWMFDLAWYTENGHYLIKELALACEIEWGGVRYTRKRDDGNDRYGEVKYDFQKLVVAVSNYKLMVFRQDNQVTFEDVVKGYFNEQVSAFRENDMNSIYILCCFVDNCPQFAVCNSREMQFRHLEA